jgi:dipeptidyl aminopeptidase/acylaminoacyl peptidase
MAQRFDPARREVSGDPSPIAEEVGTFGPNSAAGFAVSANGLLAFRKATRGTESYLKWFDRNGQESLAVEAAAAYDNPALSPDGMRIAVAERDGRSSDIWLIDVERGARTRFTSNADLDLDPVWSRDGSKILFRSSGATDLYVKDAGGVQPESVVVETDATKTPCDWSPDGRYLLYAEVDQRTGADLWVAPADGTGKPEVVVRSAFQDSQGRFSPDGRWVAFASSESGRLEVYVQGFPTATNRVTISTAGGVNPRWRGDGKELFFASVDGMMAVDIDVSSAGVLRAGRPVRLFQAPPLNGWDVSRDGKRFLVATPRDAAATGEMMPITMMANWQAATEGRK